MSIMTAHTIRILLVEDNPGDAELIQEALRESSLLAFVVTWAQNFQEAIQWTQTMQFDLVLLDLSLPDSHGLHTVINARETIPALPIVVLTGTNDEMLGLEAIQEGAQDYLIKGQMAGDHLMRALYYAITRHTMQENIKVTSMTDELTGLNNRRGFLVLAGQQMKLAQRTGSAFLLLYADLDNFKWINDTFGHQKGDRALREVAVILRQTFRESDVIARLGGDEFVVTVLEADITCAEMLAARLQQFLDALNAQPNRSYQLHISVGAFQYSPSDGDSIHEMLAEADADMYAQKRKRKERLNAVA